MLIAIPSKGRAGATKSDKVLKSAVLFVPESEIHQYKAHGGNIVGVPNDVRGITNTRNWILESTDDPWVVFVDDDVKNHGWIELFEERGKHKRISESDWIMVFVQLFESVEQLGWKIWGVKTESARRSVYPYKPFNFRSYVTASCMGIVNDGSIKFDPTFPVKEDYEICLRHIKQFGGILAARHVYWENSHWGDDGGCKDYRTAPMEMECIKKLLELYPGMVSVINRGGCEYSIEINV